MIVGFTGSRIGMSDKQEEVFKQLAKTLDISEFHHGDCIGSDEKADSIVKTIGKNKEIKTVIHPSYKKDRANCEGDVIIKPASYLERNKDIVDHSEVLVATPHNKENFTSGVWATIRLARKKKIPIYVIKPNGLVKKENQIKKKT